MITIPIQTTSTVEIPPEISYNDGIDVTNEINEFIAGVPDGTRILCQEGAVQYRMEGELQLTDRANIEIDGQGATIFATQSLIEMAKPGRKQIRLTGGGPYRIANLNIRGANADGGLGLYAYVAKLFAQHSIATFGVKGLVIDNVEMSHMYGDGLYMGDDDRSGIVPGMSREEEKRLGAIMREKIEGMTNWTEDVQLLNSRIHHNGRQAIASAGSRRFHMEGCHFWDIRRHHFDLEPNGPFDGTEDWTIVQNTFGPARLGFLASVGRPAPVRRVAIENNTLEDQNLGIYIKTGIGVRQGWRIVGNISDKRVGGSPLMRFFNCDDVLIEGNYNAIKEGPPLYFDPLCENVTVINEAKQFPVVEWDRSRAAA